MDLFRPEVYESQRFRLHGDVLLTGVASRWSLVLSVIAGILILALVVFSGHYTRTENVTGRIVSDGALAKIMASRPGVITQLAVSEGDQVSPGEILARVRVEQGIAGKSPTAETVDSIERQDSLIGKQIKLARTSAESDAGKLSSSAREYAQEIETLSGQIAYQRQIMQAAKDSLDRLEPVLNRGFISQTQYDQRRQAYLSSQIQLAQFEQQREQLTGELREARIALADIPAQETSKVNDLIVSEAALDQKRIETEAAASYVITAPFAGRVSALQVSKGSAVTNDVPLMAIVNDQAPLIAELYAPSRAIGFARAGQEVRLMFDAFPYERFGSSTGRIISISHTVLAPKEVDPAVDVKEPVYSVRVALASKTIRGFGSQVRLQPGMTLSADIMLERRNFFRWLLEPIYAVKNQN